MMLDIYYIYVYIYSTNIKRSCDTLIYINTCIYIYIHTYIYIHVHTHIYIYIYCVNLTTLIKKRHILMRTAVLCNGINSGQL